jgi:hypothetical protein
MGLPWTEIVSIESSSNVSAIFCVTEVSFTRFQLKIMCETENFPSRDVSPSHLSSSNTLMPGFSKARCLKY